MSPKWAPIIAIGTIRYKDNTSALYKNIQIENSIALDTIAPEIINDSKKAKNNTTNQAYSAFVDKNNSNLLTSIHKFYVVLKIN
jgi:Trm5-related predicted tRNA methylase